MRQQGQVTNIFVGSPAYARLSASNPHSFRRSQHSGDAIDMPINYVDRSNLSRHVVGVADVVYPDACQTGLDSSRR